MEKKLVYLKYMYVSMLLCNIYICMCVRVLYFFFGEFVSDNYLGNF